MAVNPEAGTDHSLEAAARHIEGLFGPEPDEAPAEPVEASAEEVEVEEAEVEAEEGNEPEAEETEAEAEEEVEAEPEEAEETVEATIESLSDVAEALELPLEELLANLKHTVKVDGETLDVSLSELQAGYQKDADYRQKTEALKREREAWESHASERYQALEQEHAQNAYVLNTIEQMILSEYNSDEMARLRQENPQEWSARRMEQQERLANLERTKQEAAYRLNQMREQAQQEQQRNLAATLEKEAKLLRQKIPTWGNEVSQKVNNYLANQGWSSEQLSQVFDHRLVDMAYKAMMYEQGQQKVQTTVKKVKKAPKLIKPTKAPTPVTVKNDNLRKLRSQLKKSGHINDAAALIEQTILR